MAALAHASVIVWGPGVLVGVLVWLTQKGKAAFAARHGLQAALYQLLGMVIVVVAWILWGIFYGLTLIPLIQHPQQYQEAPPPIFWIGLASMVIPLAIMGAWALYGMWAALQTLRGHDFRYAIVGKLLPTPS